MASHLFRDGPNGAPQDGIMVKIVKKMGGIPFVKTNVPQLMMAPESDNYIWGRTNNNYNKDRTAGGSSGGEGALIGARCSPLGLGTDIAGSGRIPALFCGIVGYKPTEKRIPTKGIRTVSGNQYSFDPKFVGITSPMSITV